jgi:murein DD-endopeptidase MepM/ murein hydrolase activator NlpD
LRLGVLDDLHTRDQLPRESEGMNDTTSKHAAPRMPARRGAHRLLAVLFVVVSLLAAQASPADAVTSKQLREARERYQKVQQELNRLAQSYAKGQQRAGVLDDKIKTTNKSISKASAQAKALQEALKVRVRTAYRLGGLGFFDFLLSSGSFRDFSLRAVMLERQSNRDEDLMLKLRRVRSELNVKQRSLKSQKSAQTSVLADLRRQAGRLDATFGTAQALLKRLEDQKRAEDLAAFFRTHQGERAAGMAIALARCPVAGPHAFSNDWRAPRHGHLHQGNDIFAPMGTPSVAVVSGVVSRHGSGGLGGLSIYLWGDNGVEFYYAHMSGFAAPAGARVAAGQVIGYVGNTGNARGGAPHVHFEIHPGGGRPINPYPSLVRVC